jgi:hypothetical protein
MDRRSDAKLHGWIKSELSADLGSSRTGDARWQKSFFPSFGEKFPFEICFIYRLATAVVIIIIGDALLSHQLPSFHLAPLSFSLLFFSLLPATWPNDVNVVTLVAAAVSSSCSTIRLCRLRDRSSTVPTTVTTATTIVNFQTPAFFFFLKRGYLCACNYLELVYVISTTRRIRNPPKINYRGK